MTCINCRYLSLLLFAKGKRLCMGWALLSMTISSSYNPLNAEISSNRGNSRASTLRLTNCSTPASVNTSSQSRVGWSLVPSLRPMSSTSSANWAFGFNAWIQALKLASSTFVRASASVKRSSSIHSSCPPGSCASNTSSVKLNSLYLLDRRVQLLQAHRYLGAYPHN